MKNIHVIPTDKPSRLFKFANQLHLDTIPKEYYKKYNIYITSDEKIKEGDYGFDEVHKCVVKITKELINNYLYKKIILTTDAQLIKDGVQAITDEFLEWFVKNPSCEEVEVDKGYRGVNLFNYKIIIPKEELHSMDDEVECNMCGGYMYLLPDNSMYVCTNSECTRCYEEEDEEPEQETLEEAKQEQKQHLIDLMRLDEQETLEEVAEKYSQKYSQKVGRKYGFIDGAKWQQEQDKNMYSEEEVFNFLMNFWMEKRREFKTNPVCVANWFEQFKKK
jgi:tetrahydromethanopterin S-methyltransferase subunit G